MSHLLRGNAPITDESWKMIDGEARERLSPGLAARRLVDIVGPLGWKHSATNLGRVEDVALPKVAGIEAIRAHRRVVLALVELHAHFSLDRAELSAGDRGAQDVELEDLDRAAREIVAAENIAVFHGWKAGGIAGIVEVSPHETLTWGAEVAGYPRVVAQAVELLLDSGVGGPYGLALSPELYTLIVESAEAGGHLLLDHLRKILAGPLVRAPGIDGGVVLSQRGGDFLFECGQDLSVGYASHDAETVGLYLEESFSFRVATPEAAVAIASR
jgi:uncharacterized linocin/CFP29 family protein